MISTVTSPAAGVAATPTQHNENSVKTSASTLTKTGTDSGTPITYTGGTVKWVEKFGAGKLSGGVKSRGDERIMKAGVSSVFRLESTSAANEMWLGVTWYEHTAG
jgi:hypothetical protein